MSESFSIVGFSSLSALGHRKKNIYQSYKKNDHNLTKIDGIWQGKIPSESWEEIKKIKQEFPYRHLDKTTLYALFVSRQAKGMANLSKEDSLGVNIGSSRGPTESIEAHHRDFLTSNVTHIRTSPITTAGNIASWVGHDLEAQGPNISHSITCSSSFHSILNGIVWLKSGFVNHFLVGGTEAPLTPFTFGQMKALKIYSNLKKGFPCRSMDLAKKENTMVLGEGAGAACLTAGKKENALCHIIGWGYGTEALSNGVSIQKDGVSLQKSMTGALSSHDPSSVDAIIMHAPGTMKGDLAEMKAINKVFPNEAPFCTSNKWKVGHSLGASGMLSLELALFMLDENILHKTPYVNQSYKSREIKRILINTVGFGGNAASLLLEKAQ